MKYYIKRIERSESGTEVVYYKAHKYSQGWFSESWKDVAWKYSKQGAESVAKRLREEEEKNRIHYPSIWHNEYVLEEVEG